MPKSRVKKGHRKTIIKRLKIKEEKKRQKINQFNKWLDEKKREHELKALAEEE